MKKLLISVIALAVLAGGWYAFRPERLFVNQRVNESLGPSTASAGADAGSMAMSSSTEMAAACCA